MKESPTSFYNENGKASARYNELRWVTEKRLSHYESNIGSLQNTLLNIAIVIVLGLLLIFYRPKGINVSFLSIQIPESVLYLVVVIGALFLWSNLGLSLNSAIDSRLALHYQFRDLTQEVTNGSYENQLNHVLADYSIVDNWCSLHFDIFNEKGECEEFKWSELHQKIGHLKILSIVGLYIIFGLLNALLFTVILVTSVELGFRKGKLEGLSIFLVLLSILLLMCSSFSWGWEHNYSTFFLGFLWLMTAVFVYMWKSYRKKQNYNTDKK